MMYVRVIFFFAACAKTVTAPAHETAATSEITEATETSEITEVTESPEIAEVQDREIDRNTQPVDFESDFAFDSDWEPYDAHDGAPSHPFGSYEAHALYTEASCEFAKWTINRLYVTLGWLEEFDKYKHEDGEFYFRDELLVPRFEESIDAYKKTVGVIVARFVQVLHGILETNYERLYYSDKTVLKTFVSLRIKSHYIVAAANEQSKRVEHLCTAIRLLLADMIALQSYHSMNCPELPSANRSSYFYGFSVDDDSVDEDIRSYLRRVGYVWSAAPALAPQPCAVSRTMWQTFVPPLQSSDDSSFFGRLFDAEFAVTKDKRMKIRDIRLRVEQSYDSNVIFWYQNSVFDAIVQTLLSQVVDLSNIGKFLHELPRQNTRISTMIEHFYDTLSRKFDYLPEILVNVATNLYKTLDNDGHDNANTELWKYYLEFMRNIRVIQKETNDVEIIELIDVFEEILTTISENITDFECYRMSLKYLHDEHKRAYIPFVENKEDLLTPYLAMENDETENTCKFLLNTYTLCFEIFRLTNLCEKNISNKKCTRILELLLRIKNYFLIIVKNRQIDVSLLKMSYTIATILVNLNIRPQHINYINNIQRILKVIMTELNNNALIYCTKKNFNFLLFNNINFDDLGKVIESIESIESSIKQFLIKFDSNLTDDNINKSDSQLDVSNILSLNYLYTNYIKHSTVFKSYDKKIQFYWKGTMKSTKAIYNNLTLFASNPLDLNAFYDIYFKFYIAAVYYELRNFLVLNDNDENLLKSGLYNILKKLIDFESYNFPRKLKYIISDIQKLYLIRHYEYEEKTLINDLHICIENIDEEFKKLNIIIEKKTNEQIRSEYESFIDKMKISSLLLGKKIDKFSSLNFEISENVSKVNSYFLKYSH